MEAHPPYAHFLEEAREVIPVAAGLDRPRAVAQHIVAGVLAGHDVADKPLQIVGERDVPVGSYGFRGAERQFAIRQDGIAYIHPGKGPAHMQHAGIQVQISPAQGTYLAYAQARDDADIYPQALVAGIGADGIEHLDDIVLRKGGSAERANGGRIAQVPLGPLAQPVRCPISQNHFEHQHQFFYGADAQTISKFL